MDNFKLLLLLVFAPDAAVGLDCEEPLSPDVCILRGYSTKKLPPHETPFPVFMDIEVAVREECFFQNWALPGLYWIFFIPFLDSLIQLIYLQCSNDRKQERRKSMYRFMNRSLEIAQCLVRID